LLPALVAGMLLVGVGAGAKERVRRFTDWQGHDAPLARRGGKAALRRRAVVEALFEEAGVAFPPAELLLRSYKREQELEIWASGARGERMKLVATYAVCAVSGDLGPKRREGDGQVPEGYYRIQYLWPDEAFHLAMKVGYPNASDRALGGSAPGGDIMIHGGCASIGCLAMSDERIEELWAMASETGERVEVHLYPTRKLGELLADPAYGEHHAFWANLYEGERMFEETRRPPRVSVDWRGRYLFARDEPRD